MHKQMFVSLLFAQRTIQSAMRKKRAKNKINLEEKIQKCKEKGKRKSLCKSLWAKNSILRGKKCGMLEIYNRKRCSLITNDTEFISSVSILTLLMFAMPPNKRVEWGLYGIYGI